MRIDIGQTTHLFHVDALNKNRNSNAQEKRETQGINILPRKDAAVISPLGKASSALQNLINQIEVKQEGVKNQNLSDKNLDWKKVQQDSIYHEIIEKSDNGFDNPTIEMQLRGTYIDYLNKAYEQGKDPEVNVYDHIVNIHKDSLIKAYQDVYNDIVTGYENGTREVWTQDFEEGADYIEFELEGKNYRFHKLTMEEELARLDSAYEKVAEHAADGAKLMIDTQKMIEKVMPEYQEKIGELGVQLADRMMSEAGESPEMAAERVKNKISMPKENMEKTHLFELFMEARKNWLNTGKSY